MTAAPSLDDRQLEDSFEQVLSSVLPRSALLDAQRSDSAVELDLRPVTAFGLAAINVPADAGGLGLTRPSFAGLFEVAGRRLLPVAASHEAVVLAPLLAHAGAAGDRQATDWLGHLLEGSLRGGGAVVLGEAPGETRIAGSELILDSVPVWRAPGATLACVMTASWAALVDLADPGIDAVAVRSVDAGQGLATLSGRMSLPRSRLITDSRVGLLVADWELAVFAQLLGCGSWLVDASRTYALERRQFGRLIAEYQAIAHRLADMAASVETLRSSVSRLAWTAEHRAPSADVSASLRHWAPAAMRAVAENAIQVHGGVGFTWEAGLHLYYRRVMIFQMALGGAAATARELGRRLLQRVSTGA